MITQLITTAILRGATVHTTRDGEAISTVQVLGLAGMTSWPLPVRAAAAELGKALK